VVHFRSSSWLTPDALAARLFCNAHHLGGYPEAACSGLKPPPAGRLRRAHLHLLHSTRIQKVYVFTQPSFCARGALERLFQQDEGATASLGGGRRGGRAASGLRDMRRTRARAGATAARERTLTPATDRSRGPLGAGPACRQTPGGTILEGVPQRTVADDQDGELVQHTADGHAARPQSTSTARSRLPCQPPVHAAVVPSSMSGWPSSTRRTCPRCDRW
jgi:hypothetical protein